MTVTAVLITVLEGTTDYCTNGDVQVVLIDFDAHNLNVSFPDDVDADIDKLRTLPDMPWVTETIRRLAKRRAAIAWSIRSEAPPEETAVEVR